MSMKNPLIPAGIEPATFRFVAQHLNHCATVVPRRLCGFSLILHDVWPEWKAETSNDCKLLMVSLHDGLFNKCRYQSHPFHCT